MKPIYLTGEWQSRERSMRFILGNKTASEAGNTIRLSSGFEVNCTKYWDMRAQRFARVGNGLRAVCSYGMPAFYNRYIHLVQFLALRPWLRMPPKIAVLEVGCGVGRWSLRMARSGALVTGIDLAPTMVAEARKRARHAGVDGRCHFLVADVAELDLRKRFDRILGVTVLQHILDPCRLESAIEGLARHLAPGGRLVLLEVAPECPTPGCDSATFRARPVDAYHQAFERAGLRCLALTGVDPTPLKSRFLPWYRHLPRPLGLAGIAMVTMLSLPLDVLAGRRLTRPSWHKVFVLSH